jgi:polar amino acid transport system substrate-binding protein
MTLKGVLILILVLSFPLYGEEEILIIGEDHLPPLSFTNREGRPDGRNVELVKAILRRLDEDSPIQLLPWARAYEIAKERPESVLFAMAYTEQRADHFTFVGPIEVSFLKVYAVKGREIALEKREDLRSVRNILVNRNTISHHLLQDWGFTNLITAETPRMLVEMLLSDRVPVAVVGEGVLHEQLVSMGLPEDSVRPLFTLWEIRLYISFSRGTSPETIRSWKEALRDIRDDGTLDRINRKWMTLWDIPGDVEVIGYGRSDF